MTAVIIFFLIAYKWFLLKGEVTYDKQLKSLFDLLYHSQPNAGL